MSNDLVSIIVPTFNSSEFLKECLESIVTQTYKEIEIICIDDGSTDNTISILKEYQSSHSIKIIQKDNSGVSDSRNRGIDAASGRYIMFADSDDFLEKNMVEEMVRAIKSKNTDVVRCKAKRQNVNNEYIEENLKGLEDRTLLKDEIKENIYRLLTPTNNIGCYVWALLIKKEKLVKFDTSLFFREDTDFYVRLFLSTDSVYFLNKALYNYRYNFSSVTKAKNNYMKLIGGMLSSDATIKKHLKEYGILDKELDRSINAQFLNLVYIKLNSICVENTSERNKLMIETFNNPDVKKILRDSNLFLLQRRKRIFFTLIYLNFYNLASLLIK